MITGTSPFVTGLAINLDSIVEQLSLILITILFVITHRNIRRFYSMLNDVNCIYEYHSWEVVIKMIVRQKF